VWRFWKEHQGELRPLLRDAAHVVIFLLGVGCAVVGLISHDPALMGFALTFFGLVGIVRA
jgi:hypothetical protein